MCYFPNFSFRLNPSRSIRNTLKRLVFFKHSPCWPVPFHILALIWNLNHQRFSAYHSYIKHKRHTIHEVLCSFFAHSLKLEKGNYSFADTLHMDEWANAREIRRYQYANRETNRSQNKNDQHQQDLCPSRTSRPNAVLHTCTSERWHCCSDEWMNEWMKTPM